MKNGGRMEALEEELATFCPTVQFRPGDVIYSPYQFDTVAYFIKEGSAKLYHLDESGKRLTLAILREGQLFGEMALVSGEHRELSAEAMDELVCWEIDREALERRARENPELMYDLLCLFLQRMNEVQVRLQEMVFKDLETRLARTLLHLASQHGLDRGDRLEIDLRITHQELAELVGGTRENVTTLLNRFESEALISKQRYQIAITDLAGLMARASVDDRGKNSHN